jgi:hypothetical protein
MLVFSFLLLGKIVLNVRVWHYGFTLAMPSTMLLVMPEGVMINLTVDAGRVAPTELASRRHRGEVTAILNRHPVGRCS